MPPHPQLIPQPYYPDVPPPTSESAATELFRDVAAEWFVRWKRKLSSSYAEDVWRNLERSVMPTLGALPLAEITAPIILRILRAMEAREAYEAAHKTKSHISQIMRYGIACGLIYSNPARDLAWALTPRNPVPRPAIIDPHEVGRLMAGIERMRKGLRRNALKLMALTFVRSGELRTAEWSEINMEFAEWRIPAAKMKMKRAVM
jgi:integrase